MSHSQGNELPFSDDRVKSRLEVINQLYGEDRIEERESRKFVTQITYWAIIAMFGIPAVMKEGQIPAITVVLVFYIIAWYLFGLKALRDINWCKKVRESFWDDDCARLRDPDSFQPTEPIPDYLKRTGVGVIKRLLPHADFNVTLIGVVVAAYVVAIRYLIP